MHPYAGTERGLHVVVNDEADLGIERASVLVRGFLDPAGSAVGCDRDDIPDERPGSSTPHPGRIDEQVLEFYCTGSGKPGGEPDDDAIADSSPDSPLRHCKIRKLHDLGMREQLRPIAFIPERRPAKEVPEYGHVALPSVADPECRHETIIPGAAAPDA